MYSNSIPTVSVIMPVFNVERYVEEAMRSVLAQSFSDLELIIVDDEGSDRSIELCERLADRRTRIVAQRNRGLAGARNTGIAHARGVFVALLDSDDVWAPDKLARHVAHLRADPLIGVSYADSILIDEQSRPLGIRQRPKRGHASAKDVFCGRAVQNGSAPVLRRATLDDAALHGADDGRTWYFDETLRRSEDVECWARIALTTRWRFESIEGALTYYRVNAGGLSADVIRQLETWETVYQKIQSYAPDFLEVHGAEARARELRYLARRSFQMRDRGLAMQLAAEALRTWPRLLISDPIKTSTTLAACAALRWLPDRPFAALARMTRAPAA